jgi:hypothetical protein
MKQLTISKICSKMLSIIKNFLDDKTISNFLDGPINYSVKISSTRTFKKCWEGVFSCIKSKNLTKLDDGRIDILLDKELILLLDLNKLESKLPHKVKFRAIHLLINPPGSKTQELHQDGAYEDYDDYYMIIIPLNHKHGMGLTEVFINNKYSTPDVKPGDAFIMSGSLWHRGTANKSDEHRFCLYLTYSTKNYDYDPFFGN